LLAALIFGVALTAGGCARTAKAPSVSSSAAQPAAAAEQHPLIVRLVGRHYEVSASSGPTGVVYSATNNDGRLVVANATLDELRQRHPDVYQQIIPGIAEKRDERTSRDRGAADDAIDASRPPQALGARGELLMLHAAH
jgi:hypothetical protein